MNDARRYCFGGAISQAMFFEKMIFLKKYIYFEKKCFYSVRLCFVLQSWAPSNKVDSSLGVVVDEKTNNLRNLARVSKIIHIHVMNEARRLCFGGALLLARFSTDVFFEKTMGHFTKKMCGVALPTLRFRRSANRLTVHWACQLCFF